MSAKIAVVGAGSWGTALATVLDGKGIKLNLWIREEDLLEVVKDTRENTMYLPGVKLGGNINPMGDMEECISGCETVIFSVPSHVVRDVAGSIAPSIQRSQRIVNVAKGLDTGTLKRLSQVLQEALPDNKVAVMSGPSHAEEVGKGIPTTVVAASPDREMAEYVQNLFMAPAFRVYTNPDITGVEMGGALKNVIALGAGISDGLGYGDNTKAALMTRGIVEIARLGVKMGAKAATFAGLSGIGDLIVTCTSMHSRNRRAGIQIGQGKTLEEVLGGTHMVVEGVKSTQAAYELSVLHGIEMPITRELYNVLFEGADVRKSVENLMLRSKTHETEEIVEGWQV
jgi:glycerol-3-phosphate dehydrogenase (NAD(P)+)